jgi:hypothetical protein
MHFELVKVTPEMAAKWLDNNQGNRKLREHRAAYLAKAMMEKKWKTTHQALAITKRHRLIDGQHRARAICLANMTVEMWIAYDVPEDTFSVLDAGLPRKMHERLRSNPKHTAILNSLFRLICSNRIAHEFEMETLLDVFDKALSSMDQVASQKYGKVDKASILAAVILRIAMCLRLKDDDGITRIQWKLEKLRRGDITGAPPIIGAYYLQLLQGVRNMDLGVAPLTDQFVRAWNAFDPEKEGVNRIQINDHSADVREARVEFKLITQGVFDE